jgi:hypothetical protein
MARPRQSKFIRPHRRGLYTGVMLVAWLTLAVWMLGAQRVHSVHELRPASSPVNTFRTTHEFGWPCFVRIHAWDVYFKDNSKPPMKPSEWDWNPLAIAGILVALTTWAVICRLGYVWLVNRSRGPIHLCDECGYDMTGVPSARCPECGAAHA